MNNLKITNQNLSVLKTKIKLALEARGFDFQSIVEHYTKNKIGKDHARRARWDSLYFASTSKWVCDCLYDANNLNDNHIESALQYIFNNPERVVDFQPETVI